MLGWLHDLSACQEKSTADIDGVLITWFLFLDLVSEEFMGLSGMRPWHLVWGSGMPEHP